MVDGNIMAIYGFVDIHQLFETDKRSIHQMSLLVIINFTIRLSSNVRTLPLVR